MFKYLFIVQILKKNSNIPKLEQLSLAVFQRKTSRGRRHQISRTASSDIFLYVFDELCFRAKSTNKKLN